MLVNILFGLAGVLVLFLVVAATRPAAYRVERKLEIAAPAEAVFAVLSDVERASGVVFVFGEPLAKHDPEKKKTKLTIEERVPGQKVVLKLEFFEPMASVATLTFTLSGPTVTWSWEGRHNFIGKAMSVVMSFDKLLGADIEKGLRELKTVAAR